MPITPKNLINHELIGLEVEVFESTNPNNIGIKGRVIDETMKTLKIRGKDKDRIIPKETSKFIFKLPNGELVAVDGKVIIGRPEDRVKKIIRRRW